MSSAKNQPQGTESVCIQQSPDLLPLFWSIFGFSFIQLYRITTRSESIYCELSTMMYYSSLSSIWALIKNTPDFGVSQDQPVPGSLLERVLEGSRSREPGL